MSILFYVISGLMFVVGWRWLYVAARDGTDVDVSGSLLVIASALFAIAGVLA